MARVDVAVDCRNVLGESPIWEARSNRLYWIDINGRSLAAYEPATRQAPCRPVSLPALVGTIVPRAAGGLLACLEEDIVPVNADTGVVGLPYASVPAEHRAPGMRFNDGKCDPQGRLWVGTMHASYAPRGFRVRAGPMSTEAVVREAFGAATAAALAAAALAANSAAAVPAAAPALETVIPSCRLPNGLTWSADGTVLFWIDSATNAVDAFDFDAAAGALRNRRTCVVCPRQGASVHGAVGGVPDGMTIDADGKLWVVLGESGCVVQYDPATGKQVSAVALPIKRPTACTFGGADLSELYVTTREEGTGAGASAHAGALLRVRVPGVRGLAAAYTFAG